MTPSRTGQALAFHIGNQLLFQNIFYKHYIKLNQCIYKIIIIVVVNTTTDDICSIRK